MNKTVFFNKFRRLFGFVLTISLLGSVLTASAQNARVSINMENAPISQVMKEIEREAKRKHIAKIITILVTAAILIWMFAYLISAMLL